MVAIAPVKISDLRHEVTFTELQGAVPDATGQTQGTYKKVFCTRASVGPVTAGEVERAHSFGPHTSHKVRIRYRPGVKVSQQIQFHDRTFLVNGIINLDERNILLDVYCQEVTERDGGTGIPIPGGGVA